MNKMSIYLNKEDIQNIDTAITQQKIIKAISQYVKEIATSQATAIEIDVYPTPDESAPLFTKESSFFELIGSVEGPSDLAKNHNHYLKKDE